MGVALLLTGVGFAILTLGTLARHNAAEATEAAAKNARPLIPLAN